MYKIQLVGCLLFFIVASSPCRSHDNDANSGTIEAEPAFPSLYDSANRAFIHITSESFDSNYGYSTIEEYIDLDAGKATFTSSDKQGHITTFIDSTSQTIYRYKPYSCLMLKQSELVSAGETGAWSKEIKLQRTGEARVLHLFEVAAVWMNAGEMEKSYQKSSVIYSSGKDLFRAAHRWTIRDGADGLVHLFFIDTTNLKASGKEQPTTGMLSLEMIQQEKAGKVVRTINVLSVDFYIAPDIHETLLQVPLGYGCKPDNRPANLENKQRIINSAARIKPNRLRMEATATKFESSKSSQSIGDDRRSTDSLSLDLLVNSFNTYDGSAQLIRERNSHKDSKLVTDYMLRVQFRIDLRRGTCSLSHTTSRDAEQDKFSVDFSNGLQIKFDWPTLMELFDANGRCQVIKINKQGQPVEFVFEECEAEKLFSGAKAARIMRKYSLKQDEPGSLRLESVTVWVLDNKVSASSILESYHFYIVEDDLIKDRVELARLFDISEECYLNNNQMRYGRDYAWIELTYPLASRQLDILAEHSQKLKRQVHEHFRIFFDSFLRMPRVEFDFGEAQVVVRLLLLDEPSLVYMWDSYPEHSLLQTRDTLRETTVDAEHCADLCRLQDCQAMSYCTSNYACSLWLTELTAPASGMNHEPTCTAYAPPLRKDDSDKFPKWPIGKKENLHYVLSRLRHENLDDIQLPPLPDELLYPQSVTGLSNQELNKKQSEYLIALYKKLEEQDNLLPSLSMMFSVEGGMFFLVPSKFELEQDPLADFSADTDATATDAGQDIQVPAFHEGLPMHRYKLGAFRDGKHPWDAQQFVDLTYDQCALACVDGRCSSFSYCKHRQDCTITNVFNLELAKQEQQIVQDSDCFIAQRDFLSKFNEFANVLRPAVYRKTSAAHNAAECAHTCVVESEFNCLAFDYCETEAQTGNQCYYLDSRVIYTGSVSQSTTTTLASVNEQNDTSTRTKRPAARRGEDQETGCSHFSRSYLAEFTRIAYRQVDEEQLAKLKTSLFSGKTVDQCADICLNELIDCTAFQFCFNLEDKDTKQQCTMIESKPEGQDAREFRIVQDKDGYIKEQGKFFRASMYCHTFAMRQDTSEAQMRDVALEPLSPAEADSRRKQANGSGGLTIAGAILLYLTTTAVFAAIGSGLVLLKHRSPYVQERFDRVRARLGYY